MKKIAMLLGALAISATAQAGNIYIRGGFDFSETTSDWSYRGNNFISAENKDTSWELAVEYTYDYTQNLEIGVGMGVQYLGFAFDKNSSVLSNDYGLFDYNYAVPFYLTGKYKFNQFSNGARIYLKADVGYSFNEGTGFYNYRNNSAGIGQVRTERYDYEIQESGAYAGLGIGVEYNNFIFDLMYKFNTATVDITGYTDTQYTNLSRTYNSGTTTIDYSRVTASIGYKF